MEIPWVFSKASKAKLLVAASCPGPPGAEELPWLQPAPLGHGVHTKNL